MQHQLCWEGKEAHCHTTAVQDKQLTSINMQLCRQATDKHRHATMPAASPAKLLMVMPPSAHPARPVVPVTNVESRGSALKMWRSSKDLPVPAQPEGKEVSLQVNVGLSGGSSSKLFYRYLMLPDLVARAPF